MRQLLIFLMHFIKQMLFIPPQHDTHTDGQTGGLLCVRPGSTDAHRRQAWVKRWGSGLCSLCWLSKQQRGQSEWKPSCKVISWRHICLDSEYLIKAKKKSFYFLLFSEHGCASATVLSVFVVCCYWGMFLQLKHLSVVLDAWFHWSLCNYYFWFWLCKLLYCACMCTCSCMNTPILVFLLSALLPSLTSQYRTVWQLAQKKKKNSLDNSGTVCQVSFLLLLSVGELFSADTCPRAI